MSRNGEDIAGEVSKMDHVVTKEQAELIFRLTGCFEQHGWNYALIGAMGLIVQGIELRRVTMDLDFTVLINTDVKENIGGYLRGCGLKETRIPHRYEFKEMLVDIIPVFEGSGKLFAYWSTSEKMSIVGYKEAINRAETKKIETDPGLITIKVAPIPLIVFLKLVACSERVESNDFDYADKHLNDILKCLEQYESASDRRFDYIEEVGWAEDQFECAGSFLMGMDLKKISSWEIQESFVNYVNTCRFYKQNGSRKMMLDCFKRGFSYENNG